MEKTLNELFKNAKILAKDYHKGQLDKGGHPYIKHLKETCNNVNSILSDHKSDLYIKCRIVAILHDILEDTKCTEDILSSLGFTKEIVEAIKSVTRKKNESYDNFITRASENKIGKIVKACDLKSNMDLTRLNSLTNKDIERIKKYFYSYKFLMDEISFWVYSIEMNIDYIKK